MCQNLRVNCTKNLRVNVQRASVLQPSLRPHKALSWDDIVVTDMLADMAADMEVDKVANMAANKKTKKRSWCMRENEVDVWTKRS